ncbi:MHC class II transactivator isoform X3 [Hyperolius riggenbachi]|uniref:MHC class II transactivator isoform X3 n=1 Tax=Hyperolius riggenbachi TaxID=752182 RepID=UPI0035A3838F
MNSFKEILPFVRHAVLGNMNSNYNYHLRCLFDMGVISLEYYQSLLGENDTEDLCRKIALSIVGKPEAFHMLISSHCEKPDEETCDDLPTMNFSELLNSDLDQADCDVKEIQIPEDFELPCEIKDFEELLNFVIDEEICEENEVENVLMETNGEVQEPTRKCARKRSISRNLSHCQGTPPKRRKRGPPVEVAEPCAATTSPTPGTCTVSTNTSIPPSPDRKCSSSPFAPSEVDLPSLPEPASMFSYPASEMDSSTVDRSTICVTTEKIQNEHVDLFQESQKKHYREAFGAETDALYEEVELVKNRVNTRTGKAVSKTADRELNNYDLDEKRMAKVEISNLFADMEWKPLETKIIALLGDSGMGKTVLVKKICKEWSDGNFNQFSFVFYFECCNLAIKQHNLKDFLLQSSSCPLEKNIDIYSYIFRNPGKVLLIFDGFDEFQDSEPLLQGPSIPPPSKINKVQEIFTGLFQKRLLRGCTMLITARPREKLNQHLGKVDQIIELMGFTENQVRWYIKEYFKAVPNFTNALEWIKDHQYLYSYCYIPLICKLVCMFAEANYNTGNRSLPLSLAALLFDLVKNTPKAIGTCSFNMVLKSKSNVDSSVLHLECDKKTKCAVHKLSPNGGRVVKSTPSYGLLQSYYKACHALENMNERNLVRYVSLDLKRRRNQEMCPNMVRRLLLGLLHHKKFSPCKNYTKNKEKTKKNMSEYFQELKIAELCPHRVLELFHCVYTTISTSIAQRLASTFPEHLSFENNRLTPPDVFVLKHFLKKSKVKISLDLRRTGISQKGLQQLVCLKSISSFRASLSDTVNLWKKLLEEQQFDTLKKCVKKFTVEPFRAESQKDIVDLATLVDIQSDICNGTQESPDVIKEIPAVKNLKSVIFGLGKKHGQDGFLKLVDILPKLPALQLLDLSNLTENHIGDKGIEKLVEKFSELQSLHTLDLTQNNITGAGAKRLAAALPSLRSLQTLSLYNNNVCDIGAEYLANVLPNMTSLEALHLDCNRITYVGATKLAASLQKCPRMKSLRMYSTTIPHADLLRLRHQDSRISCLSIG